MDLRRFFIEHPRVALGFSGGVDSSFLLYEAARLGADCRGYFIKTQFQPAFELEDARRVARFAGAEMTVVDADALANAAIAANPPDRCYHCKKNIFSTLIEAARRDGFDTIIDGTNASDDADDRPGMRAIAELRVLSPLRLCGLTKSDVRRLSREAGLFTHDKPSYACLATRVPTDTPITADLLSRVEASEAALSSIGYRDFRVRVFAGGARLELTEADLARALSDVAAIRGAVSPHFDPVMIDTKARRAEAMI